MVPSAENRHFARHVESLLLADPADDSRVIVRSRKHRQRLWRLTKKTSHSGFPAGTDEIVSKAFRAPGQITRQKLIAVGRQRLAEEVALPDSTCRDYHIGDEDETLAPLLHEVIGGQPRYRVWSQYSAVARIFRQPAGARSRGIPRWASHVGE